MCVSLETTAAASMQGGQLQRLEVSGALLGLVLVDADLDISRCAVQEQLGALAGLSRLLIKRSGAKGLVPANGTGPPLALYPSTPAIQTLHMSLLLSDIGRLAYFVGCTSCILLLDH